MSKVRQIVFLAVVIVFVSVFSFAEIVDKILVVVNDEVITQREFDRGLTPIYHQLATTYGTNVFSEKAEEIKAMRKAVLEQLIKDKLIVSEAKRRGIKVTVGEIEAQMELVKEKFPTDEEFYLTLDKQGITVKELEDNYRSSLMAKRLVEHDISSKISITPSEIFDFYEQYKKEFMLPPAASVRSILVRLRTDRSAEQALVLAEAILERLQAGDDFSALAKEYSDGSNAQLGGEMGYVKKGEMIKRIDETIFSLKPGEISDILRTDLGFHIFKVEDVREATIQSFDEVSKRIERMIFNHKSKKKLDRFIAQLEESAYIEYK